LRDLGIQEFRDLGIQEFRNLGIEGILSLLNYRFYPLIPQFPNSSIPKFGTILSSNPSIPKFPNP